MPRIPPSSVTDAMPEMVSMLIPSLPKSGINVSLLRGCVDKTLLVPSVEKNKCQSREVSILWSKLSSALLKAREHFSRRRKHSP